MDSEKTDEYRIIAEAVKAALQTLPPHQSNFVAETNRGDLSPEARLERVLETTLSARGWSIKERDDSAGARPMAQLAAMDTADRRVVLYLPFLRWLARDDTPPEHIPDGWPAAAEVIIGLPHSEISPARRERIFRALALAHELFHVLDEEAREKTTPRTGFWPPGKPPARAIVEAAANRFAGRFTRRWKESLPPFPPGGIPSDASSTENFAPRDSA